MSAPEDAAGSPHVGASGRSLADTQPPGTDLVVLQNLILPQPGLLDRPELFLRLSGDAQIDVGALYLPPGARVDADGWMNLFPRGLWARAARLEGLALRLAGEGTVSVEVHAIAGAATSVWDGRGPPPQAETAPPGATRARAWAGAARAGIRGPPLAPWAPGPPTGHLLQRHVLTLGREEALLPLTGLPAPQGAGLMALALTAGPGGARIDAAAFLAAAAPTARPLRLAIAITTYRREASVTRTAERICATLDAAGHDPSLAGARLIVIDNGGTLTQGAVRTAASNDSFDSADSGGARPAHPRFDLPAHPRLTLIANRNLGGAGGFARALAAARDGGFTHCLFMDDDAAFPMENLWRTAAFLRLARSDRAAVVGAMISAAQPTAIWENGAVFDRLCRPLFNGIDLTDPAHVAAMEEVAARPKPPGFYGGFWYLAFPVAAVRHDPFPFFVRGDDISFSLANRFDVVTLPGVVSVQDDFGHKESPQTLYLDLRNHLHHHLVQPGMEIGPWRSAGIGWRFILRALVRMHYASIATLCLAWEDVLDGPEHFERHADMAARRATIAALAVPEDWAPLPSHPATALAPPPLHRPPARLWGRALQATLNGHLVPFWRLIGTERQIDLSQRALIWPLWGAAGARFVDTAGGRSYSVQHDKARAAALIGRALRLTWRWWRAYPRLQAAYRAAYGPMTTPAAWAARFRDATPTPGEPAHVAPPSGDAPGG